MEEPPYVFNDEVDRYLLQNSQQSWKKTGSILKLNPNLVKYRTNYFNILKEMNQHQKLIRFKQIAVLYQNSYIQFFIFLVICRKFYPKKKTITSSMTNLMILILTMNTLYILDSSLFFGNSRILFMYNFDITYRFI